MPHELGLGPVIIDGGTSVNATEAELLRFHAVRPLMRRFTAYSGRLARGDSSVPSLTGWVAAIPTGLGRELQETLCCYEPVYGFVGGDFSTI
jgi:hypothetical protein